MRYVVAALFAALTLAGCDTRVVQSYQCSGIDAVVYYTDGSSELVAVYGPCRP